MPFPRASAECLLSKRTLLQHPSASSNAWEAARGQPALPGWCSPCQDKGERTPGKKQSWQAWPQLPLWEPLTHQRCLELIWAASGDYADIFLWLVLLDPFCGRVKQWKNRCWEEREEVRGGEKAVIAGDEKHQQEQKSEQSLRSWRGWSFTVETWTRKGEERSECLCVSHGEQQRLLTRPFSYYNSRSVRIKNKTPVILCR